MFWNLCEKLQHLNLHILFPYHVIKSWKPSLSTALKNTYHFMFIFIFLMLSPTLPLPHMQGAKANFYIFFLVKDLIVIFRVPFSFFF